jgi:F0F1-type ATP synthase assembly protein I
MLDVLATLSADPIFWLLLGVIAGVYIISRRR